MTDEELTTAAKQLEKEAAALRTRAYELKLEGLKAKPLAARMVYAAYGRCPCGAGLAYDPVHEDEQSVFVGPLSGFWDCSALMLGTADLTVSHTDRLPFAFYAVKEEGQPSAGGATTRPK